MATHTDFQQPATALPLVMGGIGVQTSNVVDLGKITAATLDIINLFTVPAGAVPLACSLQVLEDAGEVCTLDIGDTGGTTDGLMNGADINVDAGTVVVSPDGADIGTNQYTADAVIAIKVATVGATPLGAGKVQFTLVYAGGAK